MFNNLLFYHVSITLYVLNLIIVYYSTMTFLCVLKVQQFNNKKKVIIIFYYDRIFTFIQFTKINLCVLNTTFYCFNVFI